MQHVNKPQENVMRRAFTHKISLCCLGFFSRIIFTFSLLYGQCKIDEEVYDGKKNIVFSVCQSNHSSFS